MIIKKQSQRSLGNYFSVYFHKVIYEILLKYEHDKTSRYLEEERQKNQRTIITRRRFEQTPQDTSKSVRA